MAYNPFDFFRRNQKTAFAMLTIFVMFTFVLSAGQGDFFQWLPGWLGSFKQRGKEVMATVDGRKVYDADLVKHDDSRALADQFMKGVLENVMADADAAARDNLKTATKPTQETIERYLKARSQAIQAQNMVRNLPPEFAQQFLQQSFMQKFQAQNAVRMIAGSPNASAADVDAAKSVETLNLVDSLVEQVNQGRAYFPMAQGKTNADRLEYDLWLRKADKLGIAIRPADTPAFVKQDFNGLVTPDVWSKVEKSFAGKPGFTRDKLESALADEYRVRAATDVVLGLKANLRIAPYQTYQFYKEQCEAATYTVMAVPAENFLGKVTATPTDAELRDLFDKYKGAEPDPTRETPGFREPRKLKVQWLEVKGDEAYFKKLGDQALKLTELCGLGTLGLGVTVPLSAPAVLTLPDPQLQAAYAGYKVRFEDSIRNKWYPFLPTTDELIDTSVVRPQNIAAALGAFVGSGVTKASPLVGALTFKERAAQFERNDRARVLGMLLSPSNVAGTNILGNTLAAGAAMPRPLPLTVVRTELLDGVKSSLTLTQAEKDVQAFAKELARLGAKKDKSDARSYADKYIAERGLKTGGSTDFRDVYSIDEDPGLAVLADKTQRGHGMSDVAVKFGPRIFETNVRGTAPLSLYDPQPFPNTGRDDIHLREGEPTYVTWRTEAIEAATPREFAAARPKVEAAWKRMKARDLAKAAAEELKKRIDDRIKDEKAEDQKGKIQALVSDLHRQFDTEKYGINGEAFLRSHYFSVEKVAPIRVEGAGNPFDPLNRGEQAVPFQVSNLVRREMPNPTAKMRDDLLATRDKPRGTTLLETDRANDIFYVAVLVDRDDLGLLNFRISDIAEGRSPLAGAVRQEERMAAIRKLRDNTLALLKAEFHVANESEKLKEKAAVE